MAQTLAIQVSWFSWEGPNSYVFSFILVLLNSVAIFSQLYRKPDWSLRNVIVPVKQIANEVTSVNFRRWKKRITVDQNKSTSLCTVPNKGQK